MSKLTIDFYNRKSVLQIATELLGKVVVSKFNELETSARIVETEAYSSVNDKASHSFNGKRTLRNEHMYANAGTTYVYICYGIHHLFNVVTNEKDVPDAILIRAVEPVKGINIMLDRCGKLKLDNTLTKGPGNAAKALGINKLHSGYNLLGNKIFIEDDGYIIDEKRIGISNRIGVDGAGIAASYPYRFYIRGNKYVSGSPNK